MGHGFVLHGIVSQLWWPGRYPVSSRCFWGCCPSLHDDCQLDVVSKRGAAPPYGFLVQYLCWCIWWYLVVCHWQDGGISTYLEGETHLPSFNWHRMLMSLFSVHFHHLWRLDCGYWSSCVSWATWFSFQSLVLQRARRNYHWFVLLTIKLASNRTRYLWLPFAILLIPSLSLTMPELQHLPHHGSFARSQVLVHLGMCPRLCHCQRRYHKF